MKANEGHQPESLCPDRIYHSSILRCWQEADAALGHEPTWRFILIQYGKQPGPMAFVSLDELVDYLRHELA
jgi:hypothetical protein